MIRLTIQCLTGGWATIYGFIGIVLDFIGSSYMELE